MNKKLARSLLAALLCICAPAMAQNIATLRGGTDLEAEPTPPVMQKVDNSDQRRGRAYPMQPPTIPHTIDNYQVDLRANKCMACHSRVLSADSQAPMISVTHYMDRDGNFLAELSPRRYFCGQCHVVQTEARPLVENQFRAVDELLAGEEVSE